LDGDAGRLGEGREDVLVEGVLEVAAVDPYLQRAVLRPQDVRHRQHAGAGEAGRHHCPARHAGCDRLLAHGSLASPLSLRRPLAAAVLVAFSRPYRRAGLYTIRLRISNSTW